MYQSLYSTCCTSKRNIAKTDNTKFLPLNIGGQQLPFVPLQLTRNKVIYDKDNYRYYKTPHKRDVEDDRDMGFISKPGSCSQSTISSKVCSLKESKGAEVCSLNGGTCRNKNLLPVLDCRFNLREVTKQILLLEDHLSHEGKRCDDCIRKHMLFIEGLLDESVTLDTEQKYFDVILKVRKEFYEIEKAYFSVAKNVDPSDDSFYCTIAQRLRVIRKPIMNNEEICTFGCC